jgi:hypothetical protein
MGEKRGNLIKLKYDFNTAWACEIYYKDKWRRVLETDFRAFNGPRRLIKPTETLLGQVKVPTETIEYTGPLYYHGTNEVVDRIGQPEGEIIYRHDQPRKEAKRTSVSKL